MPDDEVALLRHARSSSSIDVRRAAERQVRACCATRASSTRSTSCSTNQGFPPPLHGLPGRAQADRRGATTSILQPPKDQLEEAPNLSQIDRSYWLSGDPLPVTEQNLMRGKEVFLERCVGCHGLAGRRQGAGRELPVAAAGRLHRRGRRLLRRRHRARRLLLPHPARLDRARRWRTSATASPSTTSGASCCSSRRSRTTRSRQNRVPEPKDYIVWQPSKELRRLGEVATEADRQRDVRQEARSPTRSCRRRCASSRASRRATSSCSTTARRRCRSQDAAAGIKAIYEDMLDRAWSDARARGEKLPDRRRRRRSRRRCRASNEAPALGASRSSRSLALGLPALAFAHDQPENAQSRWVMADWMMDTFFIFAGLALRRVLCGLEGRPLPRPRAAGGASRCTSKRRTTTRPSGRSTRRSGTMGMPSGDSPAEGAAVLPLPARPPGDDAAGPTTWHVDWLSLAWLWGFVIVLVVVLLLWVWQYRSTRQQAGIYPVDSFGGYTTEARRAGHRLLPPADRGRRRLRGRADRRPHRLRGRSSDGGIAAAAVRRRTRLVTRGRRDPGRAVAARLRLAAGAEGSRPGVPGLPAASTCSSRAERRRRAACTATRPGTRPSSSRRSSSAATPSSGCSPTSAAISRPSATPRDGEGVLMARTATAASARPARSSATATSARTTSATRAAR